MTDKLNFSSPQSTGAIITQFLVAIQKCFEMKIGDCVYIETDGDVSVFNTSKKENNKQIEIKEYFDPPAVQSVSQKAASCAMVSRPRTQSVGYMNATGYIHLL